MATFEQIRTLTVCCDAPHEIVRQADDFTEWQEIACTACGDHPVRTYNVLAVPEPEAGWDDAAYLKCVKCGHMLVLMHTPADEPCDRCGGFLAYTVDRVVASNHPQSSGDQDV